MKRIAQITMLFLLLLATSNALGAPQTDSEKLDIYVSITPQAYFAERVGGERVKVQILVAPGQSPATYQPTPRQLRQLGRAKVFFSIGVPFEKAFLPKIKASMKDLRIVDTSKGILLRELEHPLNEAEQKAEAEHKHEHEHEHAHQHTGPDPHIWMAPLLAKRQAQTMRDTLIELDPASKAKFTANYQTLAADLDRLDQRLKKILEPVRGREILVFHPSYGYFVVAYGLKQLVVEAEGKAPGTRQLARLIAEVKKLKIKTVFVQPQFDQASSRAIATAIDGRVVTLDPLAKDYLKNLESISLKIREALDRKQHEARNN